jgi:hypothetical protein
VLRGFERCAYRGRICREKRVRALMRVGKRRGRQGDADSWPRVRTERNGKGSRQRRAGCEGCGVVIRPGHRGTEAARAARVCCWRCWRVVCRGPSSSSRVKGNRLSHYNTPPLSRRLSADQYEDPASQSRGAYAPIHAGKQSGPSAISPSCAPSRTDTSARHVMSHT